MRYHCSLWAVCSCTWCVADRLNILRIHFGVRFNILKSDEILKEYEFLIFWEGKLLEHLFLRYILRCFFFSFFWDFRLICIFILWFNLRIISLTCLLLSNHNLFESITKHRCSFSREWNKLWSLQADYCFNLLKAHDLL